MADLFNKKLLDYNVNLYIRIFVVAEFEIKVKSKKFQMAELKWLTYLIKCY